MNRKDLINIWKNSKRGNKMENRNNWRELFKSGASYNITKKDVEVPEEKPYKTKNKVEFPTSSKFTEDKFPRSGDPSKVELNTWKSQNKEYEKAKKKEDNTEYGSPVLLKKRYETLDEKLGDKHVYPDIMGSKIPHEWSEILSNLIVSNMTVKKKPDGTIEMNIEEGNPVGQDQVLNQPPVENAPLEENSPQVESSKKVKEWEIKKEGSLSLVGKECDTHCGIGIYKGKDELEFYKISKQGHTWEELIPQGRWETKFDEVINEKK